MKNILELFERNKKFRITIYVLFISLFTLFGWMVRSYQQEKVMEEKVSMMNMNTSESESIIQKEDTSIGEEELSGETEEIAGKEKEFIINILSHIEKKSSLIRNCVSIADYRKFIATGKSDKNSIFSDMIEKYSDYIKDNKQEHALSDIIITGTETIKDSSGKEVIKIRYQYPDQDREHEMYFSKRAKKWLAIPFGIDTSKKISEIVVTKGYLPTRVTGNIANLYNGRKRIFLFFGQMYTSKIAWDKTGYPILIHVYTDQNEESIIRLENEEDLQGFHANFLFSDHPMYMEFTVPDIFHGNINRISFEGLMTKYEDERYQAREINDSIEMTIKI